MRIEASDNPQELTYLDLTQGIKTDINADETVPVQVKRKVLEHIDLIERILTPYSG